MSRTPLAWLNLGHHRTRTLLAVAGVTFAVVLIFLQLGFLAAAVTGASMIYDAMDYDILIRSKSYLHLVTCRSFPRERLYQAGGVEGVASVHPFYVSSVFWRHPREPSRRLIMALGVRPGDRVFRDAELQRKTSLLTAPEFVLIDRMSRREFGPREGRRFGPADIGVETEINGKRVRIVETFSMGTGFAADGAVVMTEEGVCRVAPELNRQRVSLGLVRLRPGADPDAAARRLRLALGDDVDVLTRREVVAGEVKHWVRDMSIGVIFRMGVAVALVVGTAIVYQVLSSDVMNHLPEYATLKAMGYTGAYLSGVIIRQASAMAVLGFLPGALVARGLYAVTADIARVPITMTAGRFAGVFLLALGMCVVSGLAALRKLRTADPADLF